jgi:two-component sensor histidine kinase
VHELVTNAAKYGALSVPQGRLVIAWQVEDRPEGQQLHVSWRESNGPAVREPARLGFGSRLIRRGIEGELNGRLRIEFLPAGLAADLTFPIDVAAESEAGLGLAAAG